MDELIAIYLYLRHFRVWFEHQMDESILFQYVFYYSVLIALMLELFVLCYIGESLS